MLDALVRANEEKKNEILEGINRPSSIGREQVDVSKAAAFACAAVGLILLALSALA